MRPSTAASLSRAGLLRAVLAVGLLLDSEDFAQGGDSDLELLGGRLLGGDVALDLMAGTMEGAGGGGLGVALAPGEELGGQRDAGDADRRPGKGPRTLEGAVQQQLAAGGEDQHRGDQVGATALVLLGGGVGIVGAGLVGPDRLVLD